MGDVQSIFGSDNKTIHADRLAPVVDKEFVLFLIGMRVNKPWKIHKWWPTARAMRRMLMELEGQKDLGLKHVNFVGSRMAPLLIQYWESIDKLMDYAAAGDKEHRPAWTEFFQRGGMDGDVGIWHETYQIKPGQVEAIYGNMPTYGLGNVFDLEPASGGLNKARDRMAASEKQAAEAAE